MPTPAPPAKPEALTTAPVPLNKLWRRRLDTLISGIANNDPYYLQIANAAEHISAEYHGRFLVELIQNANDQAVRQKLRDSRVTIHLTKRLLAVGNSGQPFDDAKVDAITSIFKSDKAADECLGNKGIGFKAVFQVADSAEVFSSEPGSSLREGCRTAFRIVRKPFEDRAFREEVRLIAGELLTSHPEYQRAIEARFPEESAVEIVLREASRAAWFTFPLPCDADYFRSRIKEFDLTDDVIGTTQTLVVLPLDGGEPSGDVIDAIDEIQEGDDSADAPPTGAPFLFLPGIASITIDDRVRGCRVDLTKQDTAPPEELSPGVTLRRQRTTCTRRESTDTRAEPAANTQDWWVAERVLGDGSDEEAARERDAIREAIQALRLPEENWRGIEKIPVAVALPDPMREENAPLRLLGATGRFCIGLPTRVGTGLPFWVSAHFHGKIDRTAIDFSSRFNQLLFDAAVELSGDLLERLKRDRDRTKRRLVTLSMERGAGAFADAFYAGEGFARTAIVLAEDRSFLKACDLRLPRPADLPMFKQLAAGVADVKEHGFLLPDAFILEGARKVLDGLARDIEAPDLSYLQKPAPRPSLLEHAASAHRQAGPDFWEPFLRFVLDRFSAHQDLLDDQAILPTGKADLSTGRSRVFFPPVRATRGTGGEERPQAIDDAGDELAAIDDDVAATLRFFDDTVVTVRTGTGRDYSPLAQRLAPDVGRGLVRRPRQEDLINDALIPAMRDGRHDHDRRLALLHQALVWLVGTPQKARQRVAVEQLLVPVEGTGSAWGWTGSTSAYLGEGWDRDPNIGLLARAYGGRPNALLVPWERFEKRVSQRFKDADRRWWLERMREIGVLDTPRVLRTPKAVAVAEARSYTRLTPYTGTACPVPCPDAIWKQYINTITQRASQTKSGQVFYLNEVSWIDGLEDEAVRPLVVEAMLRKPSSYVRHANARLARHGGEDPTDICALWVFALRVGKWDVIPTSTGLRAPQQSWFLPLESRDAKADRFTFLPCVRHEFSGARVLLRTLGALSMDEAPVARLARALQDVAAQIPGAGSNELRQIEALASDLYEAIEARLQGPEAKQTDTVKPLLGAPIPLLRGDRIEAERLDQTERVLVDDDPIRRRHVPGFSGAWVIPKRFQHDYPGLLGALRAALGPTRVARVSELPIDVQFAAHEAGTLLLDYLRDAFPARAVAEDLGLLILKGGAQASSPHDQAFRSAWQRVAQTLVVRGRFDGVAPLKACYDAQGAGGPALMVDSHLTPHEIVNETWQLLGPSYKPVWTAYAQALAEGVADGFFEVYAVSPAERMEVKIAIGLGFEQRLRKYQPAWLALWHRLHPEKPIDEFHREWGLHARAPETASAWLGWADLHPQVEAASRCDEPRGSVSLLQALALPVTDWQNARVELGQSRCRFAFSEGTYEAARSAIAGHLMAWFAYVLVPRASGASGPAVSTELVGSVASWVEAVRAMTVPADIAEENHPADAIISRTARDALALAPAHLPTAALVDPLQRLSETAPSEIASIKLKDEPDKAAVVYERDDGGLRAAQASDTVEAVLKVALALAPKHGETIEASAVTGDELVALLSHGAWANRVSVLAAVRYALEKLAPATATRMKDRQAFRDLDDWRVLWKKFDELGEIPAPAVAPPPAPTFHVLGSAWTHDEFEGSAAKGPDGLLAQRLQTAVNAALDIAALRTVSRGRVQRQLKPVRAVGGGGGARKRVPDEYLGMLGAVGEYFVYQQLKALCPDLDPTNWVSKGKERFGYGTGDDTLGYDFSYDDATGLLSGKPGRPHCLIEVKSAAVGDGGGSFEMSTNEWEVAQRCHREPGFGTYLIVRVADVTAAPRLTEILVDPVQLHLQGLLDYTSRDLLVVLGRPT
jgi:hypothetical protein